MHGKYSILDQGSMILYKAASASWSSISPGFEDICILFDWFYCVCICISTLNLRNFTIAAADKIGNVKTYWIDNEGNIQLPICVKGISRYVHFKEKSKNLIWSSTFSIFSPIYCLPLLHYTHYVLRRKQQITQSMKLRKTMR